MFNRRQAIQSTAQSWVALAAAAVAVPAWARSAEGPLPKVRSEERRVGKECRL